MKATKANHHSTLSQTKIDINEMLSLSSRPAYNYANLNSTSSG